LREQHQTSRIYALLSQFYLSIFRWHIVASICGKVRYTVHL